MYQARSPFTDLLSDLPAGEVDLLTSGRFPSAASWIYSSSHEIAHF